MNYIKQLSIFFERIQLDNEISPTEIATFIALFQKWNTSHFDDSIQIIRNEIMSLAKIKSKATYHKSMKFLHKKRYIDYQPSYNPVLGSKINFYPSELDFMISSKNKQVKNLTSTPVNEPSNKLYKNVKDICTPSIDNEKIKTKRISSLKTSQLRKEKSSAKKENIIPPPIEYVENYFIYRNSNIDHAHRFFNHYQANGWLVGGKSPMIDWTASARNWIANQNNFNHKPSNNNDNDRAKHLRATTNKDYLEPL